MSYLLGFVAAVPRANAEKYKQHVTIASTVFKELGATRVVEAWEEDVPEGELTSFPMAVKREPGEAVIFSWIEWPDKSTAESGMDKAMQDPRLSETDPTLFDGRRVIYGGFRKILDV